MNDRRSELIRRIRDFQFDDPHAARPFSKRLAEEQGWNPAFAARAIDEYRRFVVLAATAGHPVCPSKVVDEVWHLHLLYTHDYWKRFCGETLGRPLHHEPSRGGFAELAKHSQMYARTLESYRSIFDEEPPIDIWPPVEVQFGIAHAAHDDGSRQSVMQAPWGRRVLRRWPWIAAGGSLSLLPEFNPALFAQVVNPLNLTGPDFLLLYAILFSVALCVGLILRYRARRESSFPIAHVPQLDSYETAYLAGGMRRAVNTAVAQLVHAGCLKFLPESPPRFSQLVSPEPGAHRLEDRVYHCFNDNPRGESLQAAHRAGDLFCEPLLDKLRNCGLVVSRHNNFMGTVAPFLIMALLVVFGVTKVLVGMSRGRPVGFLVFGCIATLIAAAIIFGRSLHRTPSGDRELAALQERFSDLRDKFAEDEKGTADAHFPLAVGLFGMGLLSTTELAGLAIAIERSTRASGGCGAGCGGGGCGGGGCGGGGCGGCSG